jgi:MtN3 and saliva related transmembrane protein
VVDLSPGTIVLVGSVAAALTTLAFVPQVVRVWRLRDARDISLPTFVLFSVGVFVWLVYGLLLVSWPIILANAFTLVLALAILALKVKFDRTPSTPEATYARRPAR